MDALDSFEDLTELGHHLADLPVEPKYGKMILYAVALKCLDPILTIACSLAYRDPCKLYVQPPCAEGFLIHVLFFCSCASQSAVAEKSSQEIASLVCSRYVQRSHGSAESISGASAKQQQQGFQCQTSLQLTLAIRKIAFPKSFVIRKAL